MISKQINHKILIEIAKALIKLTVAGSIIGFFHAYDFWVALLLASNILWRFYNALFRTDNKNWVLFYGMILTGIAGIIGEYWGVSNNYWAYHGLSEGRQFPYWLPFAWMLAFYFLYKLEIRLLATMREVTLRTKIILTLIVAAVFPALGEVITIYLGVWTYYWPMQFLGVPLYAVICLVVLHMSINYIMTLICTKYKIKDILFSK